MMKLRFQMRNCRAWLLAFGGALLLPFRVAAQQQVGDSVPKKILIVRDEDTNDRRRGRLIRRFAQPLQSRHSLTVDLTYSILHNNFRVLVPGSQYQVLKTHELEIFCIRSAMRFDFG